VKLTKEIRESIVRNAVHASFEKRTQEIVLREHEIGMELYHLTYDKQTLDAVAAMPKHWFRHDSCLEFNCGGYRLRFVVKKPVPVPYSASCTTLNSFTAEQGDKPYQFAKEKEKLREQADEARSHLMAVLQSVTTAKRLKEIWPEGEPFYARYLTDEPKGGLPAHRFETINQMLGIKAAA